MNKLCVLLIFLTACSTLKDQAKSRQLLEKCEFSFERIAVEEIEFDQLVKIVDLAKEVDYKNPGKEVFPLLNEIRKLNFDLNFSTLDIKTTIGVTNPNMHEVILDSIVFDAFLDDTRVANVIHDGTLIIEPNSKGELDAIVSIPTKFKLKKVLNAQEFNLKGKVWLRIELIKGWPVTVPLRFDITRPLPKEQIKELIDDQKKKVALRLAKEILEGKAKNFLDKF